MSKITKLLVLLLALVMVVSLFAGCKPTEEKPNNTTTKPTQGENQNTTAGTTTTIENSLFPLEEPITFRMAVRGEKDYQGLMEKCEWYKYLCEKTNVFIECVVLGSDYVGTLNTLITANNPPDVVLGPVTLSSAQIIDLGAQGKLIPLEDLITEELMPNYWRQVEEIDIMWGKMTAPDGHIWSIAANAGSKGSVWESPLSVNIEWLKQVPGYEDGKTFPKDVEAFTEVLRYFKANDMNGNGDKTDEIPFLLVSTSASADAQGTLQGLMNLWGIGTKDGANEYYLHIEDDGVCSLAPQTQNYRDCLKWVNIWYEEGLLWDNFFTKVSSKDFSAVHGNETALWGFFNGAAWYNNGPLSNGTVPWRDAQTLVEPFETGYDVHYFLNPAFTGNLNNFTIFTCCEEPEILLAWYDQFLSLEGYNNVYRGMEDEWKLWDDSDLYKSHYEKNPWTYQTNEDGTITFPYLEDQLSGANKLEDLAVVNRELSDKRGVDHPFWSGIFGSNAVFKCLTQEEIMSGQAGDHAYSETQQLGKWIEEHPDMFNYNIWPRPYSTAEEAEELSFLWPDVKAVITKYETGFIKGDIELSDANWDAFQKELKSAGADDLVEILQGMWDRVSG